MNPLISYLSLRLFGIKQTKGSDCRPTGINRTMVDQDYLLRFRKNDLHEISGRTIVTGLNNNKQVKV